ncbi:hypothetical protein Tco_1301247 [Tanacetum coccineum]
MPLPDDPYEAIRQAYLDGTDTESEPFKDLIDTETLESPLTIAQTIPLSESTPPVLVPILRRTARMVMRVPHVMSSGLSVGMVEVAAMFESTFLMISEDAEDEGPTTKDEDPAVEDEGLTAGVEGPIMDDEGYGLDDESSGIDDEGHSVESDGLGLEEGEEDVSRGQQQAASVVRTTVSAPLGLGYGALRRRELALEEGYVYSTFEVEQGFRPAPESEIPKRVSTFRKPTLTTWTDPEDGMIYIDIPDYPPPAPPVQTLPSPEWTSGSLPISPSPSDDPSPISSPMIPLTVSSPVATPATAETERFLTELGAQVGVVREEIFSQKYQFRSLEYKKERVALTFKEIWRLVLAFEAWAGKTDAQRAALWHAISDV